MSVDFNILIADRVIQVQALYPTTKCFCENYLTDKKPDFTINIEESDIDYEIKKSDREAVLEGRKPGGYSREYLETLAVYRKVATGLIDYDILLFHGSVIAVDGEAYLFTAKSGTGKSTHTRLWREYLGERAVMVNDDKPLLKITNEGVTAYGTPWDGKHHLSSNIAVPLKAICVITRNDTNQIERIDKKSIFPMLCQQSYRPKEPLKMAKTLEMIDMLGDSVSLYRLGCNMDPEAAQISYNGMRS